MAKYHISKHGEPVRCDAEIKCRVKNGDGEHFEGTMRDALDWAEAKNEEAAGGNFSSNKNSAVVSVEPYDPESRESLKQAEKDITWGEYGGQVTDKYLSDAYTADDMSTQETVAYFSDYVDEASNGALNESEKSKVVDDAFDEYQERSKGSRYDEAESHQEALRNVIQYNAKHSIGDKIRDKELRLQPIGERAQIIFESNSKYNTDDDYTQEALNVVKVFDNPAKKSENNSWDALNQLNKTHGNLTSEEIADIAKEVNKDFDKRAAEKGAGEAAKESMINAMKRVLPPKKTLD